MSWYKQAMPRVWGKMASGIMFRHNGEKFLLQERASVEEGGTWSVPGGALRGTEGMYDSDNLPSIDEKDIPVIKRLWNSALRETYEEAGSLPDFDQELEFEKIINGKKYFIDHTYITFIVDLTDEQVKNWEPVESKEASDHQWFSKKDLPDNLHPGIENFFNDYVDVSNSEISTESNSIKEIKVAEDRWTQGQVFIEDGKTYDINKLKDLLKHNKVETVDVKSLISQLYDGEVWGDGERKISPIMVLVNPKYDHTYIKHMSRIRTSDLENPIFVRASDNKVIDGYHRLTKAFIIGRNKIKVKFVQDEQMRAAMIQENKIRTFDEIRKSYNEDGHRHHLRLVCVKCGKVETCRCAAPKTEENGICYKCETGEEL